MPGRIDNQYCTVFLFYRETDKRFRNEARQRESLSQEYDLQGAKDTYRKEEEKKREREE